MGKQRRPVVVGLSALVFSSLGAVFLTILFARHEHHRAVTQREERARFEAARLRALEDRVIFHPSETDAIVELARAYATVGRDAEAGALRARASGSRAALGRLPDSKRLTGPEADRLRRLLARAEKEPRNLDLQRQAVELCQSWGRLSEAAPALQRLVYDDPADVVARRRLGIAYLQAGRTAAARNHLRAAVHLDPKDPVALFYLGLAYVERAEVAEALSAFQRVQTLRPDYAPAALERIRLQIEDWRLREAVVEARGLIRRRPRLADAHYHLGVALFHRHDLRAAETSLRAAVRLDPGRARYHGWLGLTLLEQGRVTEATGAFEAAVVRNPTYSNALFHLGRAYLQQGRQDEAEQSLRRTLILDPRFTEACVSLGQLLKRRGQREQSRLLLTRFRSLTAFEQRRQFLEHRALAQPHRAEWRRRLGDLYASEGLLREAQAQHERAAEIAARSRADASLPRHPLRRRPGRS
jgi:tetratricopeptide (TPR) repeat protein